MGLAARRVLVVRVVQLVPLVQVVRRAPVARRTQAGVAIPVRLVAALGRVAMVHPVAIEDRARRVIGILGKIEMTLRGTMTPRLTPMRYPQSLTAQRGASSRL